MSKKNTANMTNNEILDQIADPSAMPEFANFEEEQITLPPYWNAHKDGWFYGMVVDLDNRDPEFPRYLVQAEKPLKCFVGSKDEREEVTVQPGEFFTLSVYGSLPLDRYIGVKVLVKCTGKKDVGRPQPMWTFTLAVSPEDRKMLAEDRKRLAGEAVRRYRESRALNGGGSARQLSA